MKNHGAILHLLRQGWLIPFSIFMVFACQTASPLQEKTPSTKAITAIPSTTIAKAPTVTLNVPTSVSNSYPIPLQPQEILTTDFAAEDFQDLIIFNSLQPGYGVFANFQFGISWAEGLEPHIYAFSPDGQRAGTLILSEFASQIYLSPNPLDKPMLIEYGVEFDHPEIQGIALPSECYQPLSDGGKFLPCGRFQFSTDGRYLGFFYGPDECWRAIIIQNTQTGVQVYNSMRPNGHYFTLLDNGKALIATGHCEGGGVNYYDLDAPLESARHLGSEGQQTWNNDHTAFVVEVGSYDGIDMVIWGFNIETNQLFMKTPEIYQIDDHPVWTPDKQYLLYQHRTYTRASNDYYPTGFDQARQIILVDTQSGVQKTILSNPNYDFHIGSCGTCSEWYGDWIQIRRVAFTPESITGGENIYTTKEYTCRIYGENCDSNVELYALNWKTGELKPWDEMIEAGVIPDPDLVEVPQTSFDPTQQPVYEQPQGEYTLYAGPEENTFWIDWRWGGEGSGRIRLSGPDLNTEPIYEHPTGDYAYYVGIDGKSLWMVPNEGLPLPWVIDGWNYFYLGKK